MKSVVILVVLLGLSPIAFSVEIFVPDDYTKIQDAINAALDGDTIVVRPGTYVENIDFSGKAITVQSEQGAAVTTIDGNQAGCVVTFQGGEGLDSVLEGFTVTNGSGTWHMSYTGGGGIYCETSSPTITNNTISNNTANGRGGGIYCYAGSPAITKNTITGNVADNSIGGGLFFSKSSPAIINNTFSDNRADWGGAIYFSNASPTIANNTISGNTAYFYGGGISFSGSSPIITGNTISGNTAKPGISSKACAGGIHFYNSTPIITNNIISDNKADIAGGIYCDWSTPVITNNTISGNTAHDFAGGIWLSSPTPTYITNTILWGNVAPLDPEICGKITLVTYCDIKGGWPGTGNIDADPLFLDPANGDFHIPFDSPCRSAGDRNAPNLPGSDFEGDPRTGLFAFPDIGADEFHTHFYVNGTVSQGSSATGVIIGWPKTNPVMLISGSGVLPTPDPTPYGDFWLMPPWDHRVHFNAMPDNGVRFIDRLVSTGLPPGTQIPFQALVGTELSNLWVVEVE